MWWQPLDYGVTRLENTCAENHYLHGEGIERDLPPGLRRGKAQDKEGERKEAGIVTHFFGHVIVGLGIYDSLHASHGEYIISSLGQFLTI
jgi:hypothetical protein